MNTQASFATTPSERLKKISTLSQTILRASPLTRTLAIAIGSLMLSAPAWTQQAAADQEASAVPKATSVEPMALTIDDAVTSALAKDPGVISANLDWLSAIAKADSASWKKLPSLSANAGYTRLSELSASDSEMNVVIQGMPYSVALPSLRPFRAICAWTASTSSIRDGGEMMQPKKTAVAIRIRRELDSRRFPAPAEAGSVRLKSECSSVLSIEIKSSGPIGGSPGWRAVPYDRVFRASIAPGRNRPLCLMASGMSVSSSRERSGPRSHSCAGMSNPVLGRRITLAGNFDFIRLFSTTLRVRPLTLNRFGSVDANSIIRWSRYGGRTSREWAMLMRSTFCSRSSVK